MATTKKVKLQLVGLDGNAFSLMGAFQKQAQKGGWSKEEIHSVLDECRSRESDILNRVCIQIVPQAGAGLKIPGHKGCLPFSVP